MQEPADLIASRQRCSRTISDHWTSLMSLSIHLHHSLQQHEVSQAIDHHEFEPRGASYADVLLLYILIAKSPLRCPRSSKGVARTRSSVRQSTRYQSRRDDTHHHHVMNLQRFLGLQLSGGRSSFRMCRWISVTATGHSPPNNKR